MTGQQSKQQGHQKNPPRPANINTYYSGQQPVYPQYSTPAVNHQSSQPAPNTTMFAIDSQIPIANFYHPAAQQAAFMNRSRYSFNDSSLSRDLSTSPIMQHSFSSSETPASTSATGAPINSPIMTTTSSMMEPMYLTSTGGVEYGDDICVNNEYIATSMGNSASSMLNINTNVAWINSSQAPVTVASAAPNHLSIGVSPLSPTSAITSSTTSPSTVITSPSNYIPIPSIAGSTSTLGLQQEPSSMSDPSSWYNTSYTQIPIKNEGEDIYGIQQTPQQQTVTPFFGTETHYSGSEHSSPCSVHSPASTVSQNNAAVAAAAAAALAAGSAPSPSHFHHHHHDSRNSVSSTSTTVSNQSASLTATPILGNPYQLAIPQPSSSSSSHRRSTDKRAKSPSATSPKLSASNSVTKSTKRKPRSKSVNTSAANSSKTNATSFSAPSSLSASSVHDHSYSSSSASSSSVTTPGTNQTMEKKYQCQICGKYFRRDLPRHLRTHLEITRFECPFPREICPHKQGQFNRPYDFKKHLLHGHFVFDDQKKVKSFRDLHAKLSYTGTCRCGLRFQAGEWLDEHVLDGKNRCPYLVKMPTDNLAATRVLVSEQLQTAGGSTTSRPQSSNTLSPESVTKEQSSQSLQNEHDHIQLQQQQYHQQQQQQQQHMQYQQHQVAPMTMAAPQFQAPMNSQQLQHLQHQVQNPMGAHLAPGMAPMQPMPTMVMQQLPPGMITLGMHPHQGIPMPHHPQGIPQGMPQGMVPMVHQELPQGVQMIGPDGQTHDAQGQPLHFPQP